MAFWLNEFKEIISWPIEVIVLLFLMNAIERLPIKSLNNN